MEQDEQGQQGQQLLQPPYKTMKIKYTWLLKIVLQICMQTRSVIQTNKQI